ncbi:hypothetical protein CRENBAI_017676 [Crenichthys baileyi]|uniref:Cadherin domain-containing protein n=1 Tax=Crenichthys baileyi TaxID=28760 RepID=A0AAV9RIV8_9TELE
MEVIASDKGPNSLSGQCRVTIQVTDMNDNHPEISIKSFQSPVKENVATETVIAVVSVSDKDSGDNGVVDLHIPDNMPFKLRESSDNYYELVVSEPLDREKVPEYEITFTVTDRGSPPLSDNETMTLELLDVNDNVPQFPQLFYSIRVMENNAPGALLSSLTAFDPDLHENQYLVYFIIEREIANTSMSMLFSINPENGNLYALKTFDYEIEKEFLFHIEARDSGSPPLSSNVTVHIIIVDQNDNAPVIVSPWRAHGSVVEEKIPRSTDKGSLVAKVIALDTDSVHNSRITYQFLQVTDASLFSLDQYNGEIRTMRMFSYKDSRHHRLVVVAKDNGEPALSATVTIKLLTVETDVKAYSDMTEMPLEYDIFSDINLYLVIGLGSVSFLLLITILVTIVLKCQKPKHSKAAPPSRSSVISERNSTIADSTLVSNDAYWYSLFLAETRKGKLVVRQPVPKGSRYIVSSIPRGTGLSETSDSAASTLQVTASIIVRVLDVNDNAPSFDKDKYVVDVMENSPIGSLVIKLNATDLDEGSNSDVVYSYSLYTSERTQMMFNLNPENGEIRVKEMINYEDFKLYEMEVIASDKGPNSLSGQCRVTIQVTDMNDNHPEISIKSFQSPVKENVATETVIAVVSVSDKDSGDNGVVDLHIPDNMPFKLRESSDNYYELVVSEPLDREKVPEYEITFTVTDRGSPPLSDNETMTLELLDVNDNVPQFPSYFILYVSWRIMHLEPCSARSLHLTLTSMKTSYLVYFIIEREIANTSMSMLFSINPREREPLRTEKPLTMRLRRSLFSTLRPETLGSPPLSSNVTVHIIIVDQNDNAPVIVSPLRAHGSVVEEKIPRSTDKRLPVRDQYNGEIRTMRMFSYKEPRHHRLVVVAKDNGEPALSATCQKPKHSKAAPPSRSSVISERNSTIADSTLVSNDAYWYSLFLAETRKGKLVVRQPVPKGSRYIVSSIPRGTGLSETSDSAASTLQASTTSSSSSK